jgi:crotonobetainyl-CoA:carnitine CoA-transferase CaiB-like acyl-CoA transferase
MALLDAQVAVLGNQALNWMASGQVPRRMGNGHANLAPYQSLPTADGDLIVAVGNDRQFARLCAVLDLGPLAVDPRFATNPARVANRALLIPSLVERTVLRATADLSAALEAQGVPAGPVNTIDRVFADPQVVARGMMLSLAEAGGGTLPGLAQPIVLDGARPTSPRPAPRLGEHPDAAWLPRL